jgi:hypothetical protein
MMRPSGQQERDPGGALVRPFIGTGAAMAMNDASEPAAVPDAAVRPFLVTSGRTSGDSEIPMEAQVVVTTEGRGVQQWLTFEYRDIVNLCTQPLAVAEIAARLSLHLGVIRVLVSDLRQHGIVTTFAPEGNLDVDIIMRVINGLRRRS